MTRGTFPSHPLARMLLAVPSFLWSGAARLRNRWYDRPGASLETGIPVISVGNLTVGGTGKTPVVETLCRLLLKKGRLPAIISRGYGGKAGKGPLMVSRGHGPEVASVQCGDEPFQLAAALPGVLVVVGSDRYPAAMDAIEAGADILVLDDGFQHRRLHRDLDVVLVDTRSGTESAQVLPAGPLREPFSGIVRAGLILLTGAGNDADLDPLLPSIRRWNRTAPIVPAFHVPIGFIHPDRSPAGRPDRVFAFCGIGSPAGFRRSLTSLGIEPVGFRTFPDHHRYRVEEIRRLCSDALSADATLVTTEKDLARLHDDPLPELLQENGAILALQIQVEFREPDTVERTVLQILEKQGGR